MQLPPSLAAVASGWVASGWVASGWVAGAALQEPAPALRRHDLETAAMRLLIVVLIVIDLVLFARLMEWVPGVLGDQPDPAPFARQVNPGQLKILPAPPGDPPVSQPGTPPGSSEAPRP